MKVSLNWAQKLSNVDLLKRTSVAELVRKIGAQLGEIEEVINVGEPYQHIVIAKVVSCQKHANADKLNVCLIDDGGATKNVKRDKDGLVQVVCGAPNVREGVTVAWLPPGAIVPSTYDKERFVLEARELRGVVSNGMLASAAELALGDNHDGLLLLDNELKPGTAFADAFELNDTIIDIENKMFTHRPDCFGMLGVARELAGIQGKKFESPAWYLGDKTTGPHKSDQDLLTVQNELPELVPRFMAQIVENVKVGPSPVWMQAYLSRVGIKPINNIVDITNYVMYETGQPLHAYDLDKLKALDGTKNAKIVVRHPKKGEKIALLNGKTIEPRKEAIMIASGTTLIGVGGVMGGTDTEVDENTKNIVLECATFDMYSIRRTAMAHGLFTDAVTRFNKGQSPLQNARVLARAIDEIICYAAGLPAHSIYDLKHKLSEPKPVTLTANFVNERLGLDLTATQITKLLTNVEFTVEKKGQDLYVTAPFWRTDIAIAEDLVEEVGRLYGFDHLPLVLPTRNLTPVPKNPHLELKKNLRNLLASAGANEVLTYSFVHGNLLESVGQDTDAAFQLSNALSPDLQYYRFNVLPSLLDKVHPNIKAGFDHFALFEFGKGHNKQHKKDKEGLPVEFPMLSVAVAASDKAAKRYGDTAFYEAKQYLDFIAQSFGLALTYETVAETPKYQPAQLYQPGRAAMVYVAGTDTALGMIGEFKPSVSRQLKLPAFCAGFEIDLVELQRAQSSLSPYQPLSKFPKTQQDISFKLAADISYETLVQAIQTPLTAAVITHGYETSVEPYDIYQAAADSTDKHITVRLTLFHFERTLTTEEVNTLLDEIAKHVKRELGATRL